MSTTSAPVHELLAPPAIGRTTSVVEEWWRPIDATMDVVTTPDGTKLNTRHAGQGRTIVFAHGLAASHDSWYAISRRLLAQGRRVILFDQRGHGASTIGSDGLSSASMASDYKSILEHYDVKDAVLVGHSMGGFLALRFMLAHPQVAAKRLDHAVIMASLAGRALEGSLQNRVQIPLLTSGILSRLLGLRSVARAFCGALANEEWVDSMMEHWVPSFRAMNHRTLAPIMRALAAEDLYPQLQNLKVPATVMVGENDKTTPRWHSRDMARLIPSAQLTEVPSVRHCLNIEAADLVADKLLAVTQ